MWKKKTNTHEETDENMSKGKEMNGRKNNDEFCHDHIEQRNIITKENDPHNLNYDYNDKKEKINKENYTSISGNNNSVMKRNTYNIRKYEKKENKQDIEDSKEEQYIINSINPNKKQILKKYNIFIDKQNAINSILSSTFAGIMSRTITAPLDRVKYIMQVTNNLPIYEIFKIIKKDGIVCGFFRGNCVNIVKIIPELSIKMYSYDFMKVNVYNYYNNGSNSNSNSKNDEGDANSKNGKYMNDNENIDIPFFIRFIIGSSSGVIAALFIYPLEIVKTRLIVSNKNDHSGIMKCFYNIYKNERWRNFYNGLSMHMYGVILFSGCNMSIYDYLKYIFFSLYKDYIHSTYCVRNGNSTEHENDTQGYNNTKDENFQIAYNSSRDNDNHNDNTLFKYNPLKILSYFRENSTYNWNNINYEYKKENNLNKPECSYCSYRIKNVNCLSFLFFGITSSFIAQIVSYPFLVLRTRMQTLNNEITTNYLNNERTKIKSCSFILYNIKVYGFKSLYRGIYVNLLKTIPATSITWFAYEYAMRKLQAS
ncbi:transporter [Plasmodium gonderi]|uniref:Transporter n=1 Tax=Plasmodium gonderi TaxID=77519 RepID=A0A1Y1JI89_PLAGO|nr:transporter [Plasmodium gonderi]GAW80153.1 transporter [Plasmodium gonderi]